MAWAKMHTDILCDPKLMRAARRGMPGILLLPWLITVAKLADDEGRLSVSGGPLEAEDIAALIPGVSAEDVTQAVTSLVTLGILALSRDGIAYFVTWEARQGSVKTTPEASAARDRQRRKRLRDRELRAVTRDGHVTSRDVSQRDGHVTPEECHALRGEERRGEESREEQQPRAGAREEAAAAASLPELASSAREDLTGVDAYRVRLTRAANEAVTAKWGEQPTPLMAGSGYALQLATDVRDAGVPIEFAVGVIGDVLARRPASEKPPRSMAYFRDAVLEAWAATNDPGRAAPSAGGVAEYAHELWIILRLTGLHRSPLEQREADIARWVSTHVIPDERQFRYAWGMVHLKAAGIIAASRDDTALLSGLRAALARGHQDPYPAHVTLPHPWLAWSGRGEAAIAEVAA